MLTHRQLLHAVWGPGSANETHYLRVYMGQLRHKLEADPARPRRGRCPVVAGADRRAQRIDSRMDCAACASLAG